MIELADGGTAYVFHDGIMAMTNEFGHATRMNPGTVMETKDKQKVTMVGDDVGRLSGLLWYDYRSNR